MYSRPSAKPTRILAPPLRPNCREREHFSSKAEPSPQKNCWTCVVICSFRQSRLISPSAKLLAAVIESLEKFYGQARYLANRDVHIWSQAQASGNLDVRKLIEILKHPFFDKALIQRDLERDIQRLQDVLAGQRQELSRRNELFVANEMKRLKPFFDAVESRPLTDEQQRAAIVFEDRNLLIAAAGSGKSSTVVAKIGYALETALLQS